MVYFDYFPVDIILQNKVLSNAILVQIICGVSILLIIILKKKIITPPVFISMIIVMFILPPLFIKTTYRDKYSKVLIKETHSQPEPINPIYKTNTIDYYINLKDTNINELQTKFFKFFRTTEPPYPDITVKIYIDEDKILDHTYKWTEYLRPGEGFQIFFSKIIIDGSKTVRFNFSSPDAEEKNGLVFFRTTNDTNEKSYFRFNLEDGSTTDTLKDEIELAIFGQPR